ncbi:MAG TPA: hypothetical protein VG245_07755 [Candidatus Dormibacteraeota bacterium]|nr:hypothetical protein [Candidatus Dormibacteraeota bacterium]
MSATTANPPNAGVWGRRTGLLRPAQVTLALLCVVAVIGDVGLALIMPATVPAYDFTVVSSLAPALPTVAGAAMSLLLVIRRPENWIGWLVGTLVVVSGLSGMSDLYKFDILYGGALPRFLVVPVVVFGSALGGLVATVVVQLPLVFPDGHLLSRRWLPVAWFNWVVGVVGVAAAVIDPRVVGDGHRQIANPLGWRAAVGAIDATYTITSLPAWLVLTAIGLVSLGLRFRGAGRNRASRSSGSRRGSPWSASGSLSG